MANLIVTIVVGLVTAYIASVVLSWRNAYITARSTRFAVFLSPVFFFDMWWLMTYRSLLPWLNRLPRKWTSPWLQMSQRWSIWRTGHGPFGEVGTDTFVLATPKGNILWTCDPIVISQLETMHPQSQVAVKMLKFFDLYGPTVGSVEGDEWRKHRRVIMSGFEPSTNAMVWQETTRQTQALLQRWSEEGDVVDVMKYWTSRLALHVISGVFFRKHLTWTENAASEKAVPDGHRLPFDKAIFQVIESLQTIFMTPKLVRNLLPFEKVRDANLAFEEWTMYLEELRGDTLARVDEISVKKNKSIVESLVVAAKTGDNPLPEGSILGNLFFTMMAGHETTGNTLAFALNLLAVYPEYQSKIQEDIDRALGERAMEEWTVEREYKALHKGWIGAVLKETLRLYCVVQFVPRQVVAPINIVDSNGTRHTVPADTLCMMSFAAAFRNPSSWSQRDVPAERREELHNSPAIDFDPSQWLAEGETTTIGAEPVTEGTAPRHFPFGQGPHVCPGRLFAQVELVAAIATILMRHSLQLVVGDETLAKCGGNELAAHAQTRDDAIRRLVDDVVSNVNIQLFKPLPIRLMRRA